MARKCDTCGVELAETEDYVQNGKTLCEDCFLEAQTITRTCDPWAAYTASRTQAQERTLTPLQEQILAILKTQGPTPIPVLCQQLGITPKALEQNFAPLRHLELARACRHEGQTCLTLFHT